MKSRIVYKGRLATGLDIVVRYPQATDLMAMWRYINILSKEKTYITFQGEKISLKHEREYLKGQLEKIEKKESAQLLLFTGKKLAGISSIDLNNRIQAHVGVFGITILKEFRGIGFGKLLMKLVLNEAKKLPKLKIVTLQVFAENGKAVKMYEDFGFKEYGRLPEGNLYKGKLVDDILMYKNF